MQFSMKIKICTSCKEKFQCAENSSCWCHGMSPVAIDNGSEDCICPKCLEIKIGRQSVDKQC